MTAYIIKGTHTESHNSFYLDRDGYVVTSDSYLALRDCYTTAKAAKMVATKKTKADAEQWNYYKRCNERRIAQGKTPIDYYFDACVYEAFPVEVMR